MPSQQAKALGESLSTTPFTAVYASPLKRALWTGQAVRDAQPEPKPPLTESLLLREQHWGAAEGHPWSWGRKPDLSLEEHFAQGIWPVLHERGQKFPGGESVDDLYVRAMQAVDELVMPHVWKAAREGKTNVHIALASHGLCISELIPALLVKDEKGVHPGDQYRGLRNTAWTRLTVEVEVSDMFDWLVELGDKQVFQGAKEGVPLEFDESNLPRLQVKVTDVNRHEHLEKVVSASLNTLPAPPPP